MCHHWKQTKEWQQARAEAEHDPELIRLLENSQSYLAIPLIGQRQKKWGTIRLFHPEPEGISYETTDQIKFLPWGTATAVENTYRYYEEWTSPDWESRYYETILKLSLIGAKADDPISIHDLVTKALEISLGEFAALWLHHPPTRQFHLAALTNAEFVPPERELHFRAKIEEGIRGRVFHEKKALYCPDTKDEDNVVAKLWSGCIPGMRSSYTMPLLYQGDIFGVLCVDSYRRDAFGARLREVLDVLAWIAGNLIGCRRAIARNLLEKESRPELIRAGNRAEFYLRAVDQVCTLVAGESASLFLVEETPETLHLKATTGLAPSHSSPTVYPFGHGITGWVAKNRVPLRLLNCGDQQELKCWDEHLRWRGQTREVASIHGYERPHLSVPILNRDQQCLGVIRVSGKKVLDHFTEEDKLNLMDWVPIFVDELPRADLLFSKELCQEPEKLMIHVLRLCLQECQADCGTVALIESDEQMLHVAHEGQLVAPITHLSRMVHEKESGITGVCAHSAKMQLAQDVTIGDWKEIYISAFQDVRSELAVPVLIRGRVVAVIDLESREPAHFTVKHQARVEKVAGVLGAYLNNYLTPEGNLCEPWKSFRERLLLTRSLEVFKRELPELLKSHPGQWVGYHGIRRVAIAAAKPQLYQLCRDQGHPLEEVMICSVEPEVEDVFIGPGTAEYTYS